VHLVWLELIVHPVSALVFEGEPPTVDVMTLPPRDPKAPLLEMRRVVRSAITGALLTGAVLFAYLVRLPSGEAMARSVAIVVLIAGCVLLSFAEREGERRWIRHDQRVGARFVWVNLAVVLSLPLVIEVPALARVFHVARLGVSDWLFAIALAAASVAWRAVGVRNASTAVR
jgi:Ca2+-transporting ATPase